MTSTQPAIGSGTLIRFVQTWSLQYQLLHISHSSCLRTQTIAFWPGIPLVRLQPWIARCVRPNQPMGQALWFAVLNLEPTISSLHFSNSSCPRTSLHSYSPGSGAKMRNLIPRHVRGGCYQAQNCLCSWDSDWRQSNEKLSAKAPLNISSMALREVVALEAGAYTSRIMAVA